MALFNDNKDRPWTITLDAPTIEAVMSATCRKPNCHHDPYAMETVVRRVGRKAKQQTVHSCQGIYLADTNGRAMDQLADNPLLLVKVLTILVTDQLQKTNISAVDFSKAIVGEAIERATDAMLESIADFFHGSRRTLVKAMAAKSKRVQDLGYAKALDKVNDPSLENRLLEAMDRRMEEALTEVIARADSATDSPESSE